MVETKTFLLTGATGFVGANLARRLIASGQEVHILTRPTSNKWRITDIMRELHEHKVDLLEREKLADVVAEIKPDVIFHTAALGVFGGVVPSAESLVENNLIATINLIDACNEIDYSCFVNTGSSSEYGLKGKAMRESDVCAPIDAYGVTKCAATMHGQMVAKTKGKSIICLRLFSPFGPFDDKRRLISYAIANSLQNKQLVFENKNAVRDYIFIEDVVDLYERAISKSAKFSGEIFNVGSGRQARIADVVAAIMRLTKSNSSVQWGNRPRGTGVKHWEADIRKTSTCFHWKPKHSMADGLRKTVKWFAQNLHYYA